MDLDITQAWQSIEHMAQGFIRRLPYFVLALLVYGVFHLAAKALRKFITNATKRYRKHQSAALVLGRLGEGGLMLLGALVAMVIALPSFQPAQLVQLLGIGGVAIGFAFRDILQNFLAGILILLTEPFKIGDQIVVGNFEGTVDDIETRATLIRTYDGRRVVIPNSVLFTDSVTVNTAFPQRRLQYDFGIGFDDDIDLAKRVIVDTLRAAKHALTEPAPEALCTAVGDYTITIRARWWIEPPRRADSMASFDEILPEIKRNLTAAGIDLPFPTQQILLPVPEPVEQG